MKLIFYKFCCNVFFMKKNRLEESIKRLEEIVTLLESGDIPLEESVKLFEEGIKLSKKCNESLNKIEEKVKVILGKNSEGLITEDFEE